MICFDVYLNNKKLCRAGKDDAAVILASLSWVKGRDSRPDDLFLEVGGLYETPSGDNAHPNWIEHLNLTTGDKIMIELVDEADPDIPGSERIYSVQHDEEQQRKYYEHLKAKFEREDPLQGQ